MPESDCFVKQNFTNEQMTIIDEQKRCSYYPKKNYVFKMGDSFNHIYFLYSGKIKISNGGAYNKKKCNVVYKIW